MTSGENKKTVLIVDDELAFLDNLVEGLADENLNVLTASNGKHAIELMGKSKVDLLVTDLSMPEMSGFELIAKVGKHFPRIPIIVMTAYATPEMGHNFRVLGVSEFIEKPVSIDDLATKMTRALTSQWEPSEGASPSSSDSLLSILRECETSKLDGEVVVRGGKESGRFYFYNGKLAWVLASTVHKTLMTSILDSANVSMDELSVVFEECKRTGKNFSDTIIEWQLIDRDVMRSILLDYISTALAHVLVWEKLEVMFLPEKLVFKGSLLYGIDEVLDRALQLARAAAAGHSGEGQDPANHGRGDVAALKSEDDSRQTQSQQAAIPLDLGGSTGAARAAPPAGDHDSDTQQPTETKDSSRTLDAIGEKMSDIKAKLEGLKIIDGFLGAAAFTAEGELLAELSNTGTTLAELGALANDVLLKSQKTTDLMGVGRGNMIHITAPRANILVRCLNENTDFAANEPGRAHIHMMLILEPEGNIALGKMRLEKAIQEVAPLLR